MAYCGPYKSFHLISVHGDRARDHGPAPVRGAHRLLADGDRAVLIGGFGPEYDVITRFASAQAAWNPPHLAQLACGSFSRLSGH